MSEEEKEGRLSRWAARKRAVQKGEALEEIEPQEEAAIDAQALEDAQTLKAQELEANRLAAEAVDLDNVSEETDFKIFLKEGVPELLKKQALRVLWRSNPMLANLDGLNDYDENFADPSLIMDKFESAYRVGKGYLKKAIEEIEEDDGVLVDEAADVMAEDLSDETEEDVAELEDETNPELSEDNDGEMAVSSDEVALNALPEDDHEEEPAPKLSLRQRRQLMGEL